MTDVLDRLRKALADRYTIEREIGSGGMATVYHAQDLKHERQVAMKVLRPELAAALGPERFLQEIKIAANLHHPHILPLYDSGEADGFLYYVMPYVEGESLRDRLEREKQLAIDDALQVAREVADALSYAHAHGVIHRDIKPENILLESGHAVVADFGIARAVDAAGGERLTETGIAIGTPTYMSPEQAAGSKDLDGRSDLYSLGCVLHEMLAGQPPFTGPTVESVVHQHLSAEPPSVTVVRPSVPGWVAAALERSLAKTPADRFNPVALFGEAISPRTSVTADSQPVAAAAGRRRWLVPGVLAAALVIVVAVVVYRMSAPGPISIATSNSRAVTSEQGLEFQPAVSPDGEDVAYVVGPVRSPRIAVRSTHDVGSGGELRLGEDVDGLHWLPAWMPDGGSVVFLACAQYVSMGSFGSDCDFKEVGRLGGSTRTVSRPRVGRYAWSRDGTRVAFAVGQDSIFAYSVQNGEPELLPDGQMIAYVNGNPVWRLAVNVAGASIWLLDADGGVPVPVTDERHLNLSPQWLPDSQHLLFISNREGQREVYVVEVGPTGPRGEPQKVPGPTDPHSISVSADGRRLAYARFPAAQNIWSIPIPDGGVVSIKTAVPVTTRNQVIETHSLSPDGEWIAFDSDRRGEQDIYKMRTSGGDPQLVADIRGNAGEPRWSPDGEEIVFYSHESERPGGGGEVRVVSADGGTPSQLTDWPGSENRPYWSPDGLAIVFQSQGPDAEGSYNLWIMPRDSIGGPWGDPVRLTEGGHHGAARWSPDGASLLCYVGSGAWERISSRDGEVLSRYDPSIAGLQVLSNLQFSPDGSRIYFHGGQADGSQGLWWMPTDGGDVTKVVAYDDPALLVPFGLSVGEKHLYLTIAQYESDIWVMDLEW
jgi:serine/threonine-protein kinase